VALPDIARMSVDLSSLHSAIAKLAEAVDQHRADATNEFVRDSVIQRFEFTYDLSAKSIRRVLEEILASPAEIARMSFPTMIRTAWEQGLIASEWADWHRYREMRNITSHTYDEGKAKTVAAAVPGFLDEAKIVASRLEEALSR
jgi:nucleotidyltransferase substrate binding protein (TIGR01987 family)